LTLKPFAILAVAESVKGFLCRITWIVGLPACLPIGRLRQVALLKLCHLSNASLPQKHTLNLVGKYY